MKNTYEIFATFTDTTADLKLFDNRPDALSYGFKQAAKSNSDEVWLYDHKAKSRQQIIVQGSHSNV